MITAPSTNAPPTYPRTSNTAEPFGVDCGTACSGADCPSNRSARAASSKLRGLCCRNDLLLDQAGQLGFESAHHHILPRHKPRLVHGGAVPAHVCLV